MKEKQSVKELQPYVVNPTVCSVKLDANEGDKNLFKDLVKELGDNFYLNVYPDDNYTELKKAVADYIGKRDKVLQMVKSTDEIVIVDEAYMEFGEESVVDEIENYKNLIVVKTLSKAFSMAGIRTGYLLANEELVKTVEKVRAPYNLNSISAFLATKALQQKDKMLVYVNHVKKEREKVYKSLLDMGIKAFPSGANFVFFYCDDKDLEDKLVKEDVLIRKFGGKLDNHYRVTIGTNKENNAFVEAMKKLV